MFGHFCLRPHLFSFPFSTHSCIPNFSRMFPFTFPLTSPKFLFLLEGLEADNQMFKSPMDD